MSSMLAILDDLECRNTLMNALKNAMLTVTCTLACLSTGADVKEFPRVNVTNVRRVFHNGEHNAFTDLIRWKRQILACFPQLSGWTRYSSGRLDHHSFQYRYKDLGAGPSLSRCPARYA